MSDDFEGCMSRRRWLMQSAGVACVAAAGPLLAHCGGGGATGPINAGAVSTYSVGTFQTVGNVIVGRDGTVHSADLSTVKSLATTASC